ncbi:MAG: threonyl-tRNA synthetase [Planctomycetes bacterium]|nr:threonyl-tRNA synthetase [Planctomycetota bacterium]
MINLDKIVTIPSIILSGILIIIYLIRCLQRKTTPRLTIIINCFFIGSGIVCGILLFASSILPDLRSVLSNIDLYIAISGVAVLCVSIIPIKNEVFLYSKSKEDVSGNSDDTK